MDVRRPLSRGSRYDAAAKFPAPAEINARYALTYALAIRSAEALLEAGAYFSSVELAQIAHGPDSLKGLERDVGAS